MQINDRLRKQRIAKMLGDNEARSVIRSTLRSSKSVAQISEELGLPSRTAYRYVTDLCDAGILARDRNILLEGGGKYVVYKSMVRSVMVRYDGLADTVDVEVIPNDTMLDKFFRFWTTLGQV